MVQKEFDERVKSIIGEEAFTPITKDNLEVINQVYTHHPAIQWPNGKAEMVDLYVKFGMTVIKDMEARANKISELKSKLINARRIVEIIEEEIREAETAI